MCPLEPSEDKLQRALVLRGPGPERCRWKEEPLPQIPRRQRRKSLYIWAPRGRRFCLSFVVSVSSTGSVSSTTAGDKLVNAKFSS